MKITQEMKDEIRDDIVSQMFEFGYNPKYAHVVDGFVQNPKGTFYQYAVTVGIEGFEVNLYPDGKMEKWENEGREAKGFFKVGLVAE